jgi:hypothetical protein
MREVYFSQNRRDHLSLLQLFLSLEAHKKSIKNLPISANFMEFFFFGHLSCDINVVGVKDTKRWDKNPSTVGVSWSIFG